MGGRIVQLLRGERLELAFDDFDYWIRRFAAYPLVQLIDLDAAMRQGDNRLLIEQISKQLPCQVGGGIASVAKAEEVLSAGAKRVIVAMQHTAKGKSKIVTKCNLPLTSARSIDLLVTDMAVIAFPGGKATLKETAPGVTVAEVLAVTEAELAISDSVLEMKN